MAEPTDLLHQASRNMIQLVPQAVALGFELIAVETARGRMKAPWREDLVGDPDTGVIAGGVITTLLDHVCGLAIKAATRDPWPTATLDLRIDYMRPAAPRADVIAEAHCYKLTRTIAFVRASAYDADPADPIATAQAAFVLNRPEGA
jgi:uncharacterized protein (TIGR00369 family)